MMKTWWALEPILEEVTKGLGTDLVMVFPNSCLLPRSPRNTAMPKPREEPLLASAFGKTGELKLQLVPLWLSVYFCRVEVCG